MDPHKAETQGKTKKTFFKHQNLERQQKSHTVTDEAKEPTGRVTLSQVSLNTDGDCKLYAGVLTL